MASSTMSSSVADAEEHERKRGQRILVVDTCAFIKRAKLHELADELYSIEDVVNEVKDAATRQWISSMPFKVKFKEPSDEAISAVSAFAKKTGDYASLSYVDIKVMGLTWMLEKQYNGSDRLNTEPVNRPSIKGPVSSNNIVCKVDRNDDLSVSKESVKAVPSMKFSLTRRVRPFTVKSFLSSEEDCDINVGNENEIDETTAEEEALVGEHESNDEQENITVASSVAEKEGAWPLHENDGDGSWITPDNIDRHNQRNAVVFGNISEKNDELPAVSIGCMTTDFAMQNVLMQLGLPLISVDGMQLKRVKTYVLKCHACNAVESIITKEFCRRCGNHTLLKIAVSVDKNGQTQYIGARTTRPNTRGTIYSIPLPKGGRHSSDLILREDQRERLSDHHRGRGPQSGPRRANAKNKTVDVFDSNYTMRTSPFDMQVISKHGWRDASFGYGKKNPNVSKKRINKKK